MSSSNPKSPSTNRSKMKSPSSTSLVNSLSSSDEREIILNETLGIATDISQAETLLTTYFETLIRGKKSIPTEAQWAYEWGNKFSAAATDLEGGLFNLGLVIGKKFQLLDSKKNSLGEYIYRIDWDQNKGLHFNVKFVDAENKTRFYAYSFGASQNLRDISGRNTPLSRNSYSNIKSPTSNEQKERELTSPVSNNKYTRASPSFNTMKQASFAVDNSDREKSIEQMIIYTREAVEKKQIPSEKDAKLILSTFEMTGKPSTKLIQDHFIRFGDILRPLIQNLNFSLNSNDQLEANKLFSLISKCLYTSWKDIIENPYIEPDTKTTDILISECLYARESLLNPNYTPREEKNEPATMIAQEHDKLFVAQLIRSSFENKTVDEIILIRNSLQDALDGLQKTDKIAMETILDSFQSVAKSNEPVKMTQQPPNI